MARAFKRSSGISARPGATKSTHVLPWSSKKWSPHNEEIAHQIQEIGAENVPVLAAVFNPETGTADIYQRRDADGLDWGLLLEGVSLNELGWE